jgi:hypothetical protein
MRQSLIRTAAKSLPQCRSILNARRRKRLFKAFSQKVLIIKRLQITQISRIFGRGQVFFIISQAFGSVCKGKSLELLRNNGLTGLNGSTAIEILKIELSPLLDPSLPVTNDPADSGNGTGHHGGDDFSELPEAKGYFYAPIEDWDAWD